MLNLNQFTPTAVRNPAAVNDENPFTKLKNAIEFERGERRGGASDTNAPLIILADKNAPYQLLKQVMGAAAGAGFLTLKLVVIRSGE